MKDPHNFLELLQDGKQDQVKQQLGPKKDSETPYITCLRARIERLDGNFLKALELLQPITMDELQDTEINIMYHIELAANLMRHGKDDEAFEVVKKIKKIPIKKNTDVIHRFMIELRSIEGIIHINTNRLEKAISRIQEGLELTETHSYPMMHAALLNALGVIHFFKGELDVANKCYVDSMLLNRERDDMRQVGMTCNNIGYNYYIMRDGDLSMDYLTQAYEIFKGLGNDYYHATAIFNLIRTLIFIDDTEQAQQFLGELEEIANREENIQIDRIQSVYKLSNAIILEQKNRLKNKIEAKEIFQEVIEENQESQFVIIAMIHLAELLLMELKLSGEQEVLEEIQEIAFQLESIAESNQSVFIKLHSILLSAKIKILRGKFDEAYEYYKNAEETAAKYNIKMLQYAAVDDLEKMKKRVLEMREILDRNVSITDRMQHSQVENYLQSLKNII